jgi:outer membrane protein TolC
MNMRIPAYSPGLVPPLVPDIGIGVRGPSVISQAPTAKSGELVPNKTSPKLNPPTLLVQNTPIKASAFNAQLTPQSLFDSVSNAQESQLALAALLGNEAYAKELEAGRGRVQMLGSFNLNFSALTKGDLIKSLAGTLGGDIPLKNNSIALQAEAKQRQKFSAAALDNTQQRMRFLVNGLLFDASTRKTSINDLKEIEKAQEEIVSTLKDFQKLPGSKITNLQVSAAQKELQKTKSSLAIQLRALNQTFDQIKKLTGNPNLTLDQVPTLKNSQQTVPASIVTNSQYLKTKPDQVIEQAIQNNPDIKTATEALALAKARYEVVKGSAVSTSARGPLNILGQIFENPIGGLLGVVFNAFRGEKKDVTTQLAEAKGIIDAKEMELETYKTQIAKDLTIELDTVNGPLLRNQVETQKDAVNIAYESYKELADWAAVPGSPVTRHDLLRAKVTYLQERQAYNESAQQLLVNMNRIVALGGGYGDPNSELFRAFNGNFNLFWGPDKRKQP